MMRFGQDKLCSEILATVPSLEALGLTVLRADARPFNDNLLNNVRIYMHGCDFGIAIFDEVEEHTFNPNIAFETGYMFGLEKPVLLLKDRRLRTLPSDLLGLLYKEFDPDNVRDTVPQKIREFAAEKDLL